MKIYSIILLHRKLFIILSDSTIRILIFETYIYKWLMCMEIRLIYYIAIILIGKFAHVHINMMCIFTVWTWIYKIRKKNVILMVYETWKSRNFIKTVHSKIYNEVKEVHNNGRFHITIKYKSFSNNLWALVFWFRVHIVTQSFPDSWLVTRQWVLILKF